MEVRIDSGCLTRDGDEMPEVGWKDPRRRVCSLPLLVEKEIGVFIVLRQEQGGWIGCGELAVPMGTI